MSETSYQGSCFCGAIKLTVPGVPADMSYFTLWPLAAVKVTKGEDKLGSYARTDNSHRKWCTQCGGHVLTGLRAWV